MKITLLAALSKNGVIGNKEKMPWHIPRELKHFRKLTLGNAIFMGRKTFEAIGKTLDERLNIVISNTRKFEGENLITVKNIEEGISVAENLKYQNLFVIGGESVFKQTIDSADELILSFIKGNYVGDKFFPIEKLNDFKLIEKKDYEKFIVKKYLRNGKEK